MARFARVVGKADTKSGKGWVIPTVAISIVVVVAAALVWTFKSSGPQFRWQPHLRTDADYSIDMPDSAQTKVQQEQTQFGPTTVQTLQCQTSNPQAIFTVQYSPFPANSPFLKMTAAQADTALVQFVSRLTEQLDGQIIEQKVFPHAAGLGRTFRIQLNGKKQYHGRCLYLGAGQYQLSVIAPEEENAPAYVSRFFNSFEYRGKQP